MSYPAPASLRSPCDLRRADRRRRRRDGTVGRPGHRLRRAGRPADLRQLPAARAAARPPSTSSPTPPAHDELLFITIHQVYELWFQQLLHEATAARDAMLARRSGAAPVVGPAPAAADARDRAGAGPAGRRAGDDDPAGLPRSSGSGSRPASGFQSVQFRELEFLSGAKDPSFVRAVPRAHRRREGTGCSGGSTSRACGTRSCSVLDAARAAGGRRRGGHRLACARVAHDRSSYADVWALAEALLQHDELAAAWRARHVVMVERMIGTKTGTGGSTGATTCAAASTCATSRCCGTSARCSEQRLRTRPDAGVGGPRVTL